MGLDAGESATLAPTGLDVYVNDAGVDAAAPVFVAIMPDGGLQELAVRKNDPPPGAPGGESEPVFYVVGRRLVSFEGVSSCLLARPLPLPLRDSLPAWAMRSWLWIS